MTAPKIGRMVKRDSAAYLAAEFIFKHGPQLPEELVPVADFGHKMSHKQDKLDRAILSGWLAQDADGKVDCGAKARAHFQAAAGLEADVKPLGQIAAARQQPSVFARPPLSKKYIPNRRGLRHDVPEWSVRTSASFKSLAGGDA